MEKDWLLVYETDQMYQAEIAKQVLSENDIESIIINKKDSSYLAFGNLELYVFEENYENALGLLKDMKVE
jgi:hypothetical protein